MTKKAEKLTLREKFSVCPSCRYSGGFHVIFKGNQKEIKMNLVCPSCHDEFDLNLSATISDSSRST